MLKFQVHEAIRINVKKYIMRSSQQLTALNINQILSVCYFECMKKWVTPLPNACAFDSYEIKTASTLRSYV